MSASGKISFMNKFVKFISRDGLELWWKTADQSKQVQGAKSLLLSSFCLLEWGEGSSPALPESRQTFEVAAAQTSRRVNRVFSRQTVFFFSFASFCLLINRWSHPNPLSQAHSY